ncbi:hypothetical protein RHMOL_Rhmol08G0178800 [Rhododendron molle]|uniref:Uncharacterized protein n=1 Tax=Rhododendron molle TaxID=49168 RepID=A0ACC0MRK4_RHOML|nr:hypothetical protein RHMOL_Rhmol08G0178800 [Rhododendron molle]
MTTLNAIIGDLHAHPIQLVQLDPTSTRHDPIFTMTDPNSSQTIGNWFKAMMPALPKPELEIDMQAIGWA